MPNEHTQPFNQTQRNPDDAALVEGVLGFQVADEMKELAGGAQKQETKPEAAGLDLSADEQATTTEAEKTMAEMRREEYVVWAKGLGDDEIDEEWVDETFFFENDGRVSVPEGLGLAESGVTELPSSLYKVGGNINLYRNRIVSLDCNLETVVGDVVLGGNKLNSLKGLPERVNGYLSIDDNPLESLDDLPKYIGGDLWLVDIPATSIPAGLDIQGTVFISENQKELTADCKSKGYTVMQYDG